MSEVCKRLIAPGGQKRTTCRRHMSGPYNLPGKNQWQIGRFYYIIAIADIPAAEILFQITAAQNKEKDFDYPSAAEASGAVLNEILRRKMKNGSCERIIACRE